jgi:ribonuclease HI
MVYGWILTSIDDREVIASGNKTCGTGSSNVSEYRALIAGLRGCLKAGVDIVHIIGDSQLVIKQVTMAFKTNKPELIKHRDCVLELLEQFEDHTIKWVPRRENKCADALVNEVFNRKSGKCSKKRR